jgi:hypothetical protein
LKIGHIKLFFRIKQLHRVVGSALITVNDRDIDESPAIDYYFDRYAAGFSEWPGLSADKRLERLVFRVSRTPQSLQAHLERIYFCFGSYLNEQLYAALIDLLIVLNRCGRELSCRMTFGSRARLTESQFQALSHFLNDERASIEGLPCSRFSLFTKGLQSYAMLVQVVESVREAEHDPLELAKNYIEFSQLDEAVRVLEQAILERPERTELHGELLSLYRSTSDRIGFKRIFDELTRFGASLPPEWAQLQDFLKA